MVLVQSDYYTPPLGVANFNFDAIVTYFYERTTTGDLGRRLKWGTISSL